MITPQRAIGKIWRTASEQVAFTREMSRLRRSDRTDAQRLGRALHTAMNRTMVSNERVWVNAIEGLRAELSGLSREVVLTDFGAGEPDCQLGATQMSEGRVVRKVIGEVCQNACQPMKWALLLFAFIREFKPAVCLELGTALGISTAYQAAALELNGFGLVVSLEGAPALASIARQNLQRLGLHNVLITVGRFQDTLVGVLLDNPPIDFVFIDGHHDERATVQYFEQIVPFVSERGVVVIDDVSWCNGMRRAWDRVTADPRVSLHADLSKFGICLIRNSTAPRSRAGQVPSLTSQYGMS